MVDFRSWSFWIFFFEKHGHRTPNITFNHKGNKSDIIISLKYLSTFMSLSSSTWFTCSRTDEGEKVALKGSENEPMLGVKRWPPCQGSASSPAVSREKTGHAAALTKLTCHSKVSIKRYCWHDNCAENRHENCRDWSIWIGLRQQAKRVNSSGIHVDKLWICCLHWGCMLLA